MDLYNTLKNDSIVYIMTDSDAEIELYTITAPECNLLFTTIIDGFLHVPRSISQEQNLSVLVLDFFRKNNSLQKFNTFELPPKTHTPRWTYTFSPVCLLLGWESSCRRGDGDGSPDKARYTHS
jgi:hypothetical protein